MHTGRLRVGVLLLASAGIYPALADEGLVGSWVGSFVCNRDSADMTLVLSEKPNMLEGKFTFKNKQVKGSYKVAGKLARDDRFVLLPMEWLEKPNRVFAALRMEGSLNRKTATIEGTLPECRREGTFSARRGEGFPEDADPPVNLAGLGGTIASAKTAQQQCGILKDWLQPFGDVDARTAIDVGLKRSVGAFQDEVFEPVFGTTLLFMTPQQQVALRNLNNTYCRPIEGMDHVNLVVQFGLGSSSYLAKLVKMISESSVNDDWAAEFELRLKNAPDDVASLTTFNTMRSELGKQQRNLLPENYKGLQDALGRREQEVKIAIVRRKLAQIPDDSFDDLGLNTLFSALAEAERYKLDRNSMRTVTDEAEAKARAILRPVLQEAQKLAAALPSSLEGLEKGEEFMRTLQPYRASMDRMFGTIDRDGNLKQLHAKLRQLRNDPTVVEAFRDVALKAANDPVGEQAVKALAAKYFGNHPTFTDSDFDKVYREALELAEVKSVKIINLAVDSEEGEPTAEDIAAFALQRVRDGNEQIAAQEDRCMAGKFSNSFDALTCLNSPGVFTGQKGFGMRLLEVRKVGCTTVAAKSQYKCIFTQQLQINLPGADQMGWGSMVNWAERASRGEPLDALFIRAAGGSWTVVWGDL